MQGFRRGCFPSLRKLSVQAFQFNFEENEEKELLKELKEFCCASHVQFVEVIACR